MSVTIAPHYTQRVYSWTVWKTAATTRGLLWQHDEDSDRYTIWGYDGPEVHMCTIWKGIMPDSIIAGGYTQEQNDADKTDWETNFKPTSNGIVENKAKDGRLNVRMTAANNGRNFRLRTISLYSADPSKIVNNTPTGTSHGDITYKMYDSNGTITTTNADAVKTVVDFEPTYNYDIIGGFVDLPVDLRDGTSDAWFISVMAVPDVPYVYGGSIDYVSEVNLEAVTTRRVISDGRASSTLKYNATYHTNKLRFTIKHPQGVSKRFQIYLEIYI